MTPSDLLLSPSDYRLAKQTVEQFLARFPEQAAGYKLLAMHSALPLILTPELLNYLRTHFLRSQTPWLAESDLLLSDLYHPVGYEQYIMVDMVVRDYLLAEMKADSTLGPKRMAEIARLLISYMRYLSHTDTSFGAHELQAQQWGAMVYIEDQRKIAAAEIV